MYWWDPKYCWILKSGQASGMHTAISNLHISLLHMVCMHIIQWFIFLIFVYISTTVHIVYRWSTYGYSNICTPKIPLKVFFKFCLWRIQYIWQYFVSSVSSQVQICIQAFGSKPNIYPFIHLFMYSFLLHRVDFQQ